MMRGQEAPAGRSAAAAASTLSIPKAGTPGLPFNRFGDFVIHDAACGKIDGRQSGIGRALKLT